MQSGMALQISAMLAAGADCQIASKSAPLFASNSDPFGGPERHWQ